MSERWLGLHNSERHTSTASLNLARCEVCARYDGDCSPTAPCQCCLEAEVESLQAQVQAVRELWMSCGCDRCTSNRLAVAYALGNPEGDDDSDGAP